MLLTTQGTQGRPTPLQLYIPLGTSSLVTQITPLTSGNTLVRPNGLFISWYMKMLPTLRSLLVNIHPLPLMLFVLRVLLHVWTPGELPLAIPYIKVATSFLLKVVIISPSSPPIPKVVAGFHLLASQSNCVPGQLELFSTTLPLGGSDSAFSLQSALSVQISSLMLSLWGLSEKMFQELLSYWKKTNGKDRKWFIVE